MSIEEKIGSLTKGQEDLTKMVERHIDASHSLTSVIDGRLNEIEDSIKTMRFTFVVIRAIFLTVAFLVTVRFGDIKALWHGVAAAK